ncbi:hypothetical protein V2G26_014504 [Clonostachys chloroleuca]
MCFRSPFFGTLQGVWSALSWSGKNKTMQGREILRRCPGSIHLVPLDRVTRRGIPSTAREGAAARRPICHVDHEP